MSKYIEKVENFIMPQLSLFGIVVFPSLSASIELSDKSSIAAVNAVADSDGKLFVCAVEDASGERVSSYDVGVIAKVRQVIKLPDGHIRVLLEGKCRAERTEVRSEKNFPIVSGIARKISLTDNGGVKGETLMRETVNVFQKLLKLLPKVSHEVIVTVQSITDPGFLADYISANVLYKIEQKQEILYEINPLSRLERLLVILENERAMLKNEIELQSKVKQQIDRNQREYYLREQMKVIQQELGDGDMSDIEEYEEKLSHMTLPEEVEKKVRKELSKLEKMPYSSAESTVIRNYLDTCLEMPWSSYTEDKFDVALAAKILDEDHDGLEKVKERILEFIAVRQLSPELKGQVICLVGPPGVGKSSVAVSIARALGRKFVRVSLGGVRDEADIRGHRKTYIASMPGRIANAIKQAEVMNPVILLDEIDKLTRDSHGDPSSALLEVLDSDQNKTFRDHFLELPLNLSDCIFIATANTLETVARPLIDRMEVISLRSYTRNEKLAIFKNHLFGKELKRHGLKKSNLKITDEAILEIIDYYTKESGVRNLSRETASLCRKVAKKLVESGKKSFTVTKSKVSDYLGKRKYKKDDLYGNAAVGVVNGLAWTEVGGEILQAEAVSVLGTGKLELTGKLGDVMKESAQAAITYIRKNFEKLGIDADFYKNRDIHIHFPEGAVPKDGPSAGVTTATAVVSELSGIPVRADIAMTGEITLHGRVLPIGGLREKTMAAYRHGISTIIIPFDNRDDLDEVDDEVKSNVRIIPVKTIDAVLEIALVKDFAKSSVSFTALNTQSIKEGEVATYESE